MINLRACQYRTEQCLEALDFCTFAPETCIFVFLFELPSEGGMIGSICQQYIICMYFNHCSRDVVEFTGVQE